MDKEKFYEEIVATLTDYYGSSAEVMYKEVEKLNNTHLPAVNIKFDGSPMAPVIYLDFYYEQYQKGCDYNDIIEQIVTTVGLSKLPLGASDEIVSRLDEYNQVKEDIYPMLINAASNKELLANYAHTMILDLAVIYAVRLDSDIANSGIATVKVTNDLLSRWRISIDEIHAQSVENLKKDGYQARSMYDVLKDLVGEEIDNFPPGPNMMVLSSNSKMYGTAGILDPEIMKEITAGKDYYMIPSSIHEFIMVPYDDGMSVDFINNMIHEVNSTQVSPSEILSDHVYLYNVKDGLREAA